jgi:hypothetical protein
MLADALGTVHAPVSADDAVRIVSLVPSLTELLCELGLQAQLVGRTGFCIHPRGMVQSIEKVGGTKDVNIDKIRALAPTHLVVNIDENEKPTVAALAQFIPNVIVTHPQTPRDNIALYRLFGTVFGALPGVAARAQELEDRFEAAYAALMHAVGSDRRGSVPRDVLYCIWQDPWMTVSRETYIAQMLALIGWRQWQAPDALLAEGAMPAVRYPRFAWSEAMVSSIDAVLLSTEPYSFRQTHVDLLEKQIGKPVHLVDGEMLSWYGSRAIAGLAYLQTLRATSGD